MATLTTSTTSRVYQRAMETASAQLSGFGLAASPWHYDLIPGGTRDVAHGAYGVSVLRTYPQAEPSDKQRGSASLNTISDVGLRFTYRIRPDNMQTDYKSALTVSDLIVIGLISAATGYSSGASGTGPQHWRWVSTTSRLVADGTHLLVEQTYKVWHLPTLAL